MTKRALVICARRYNGHELWTLLGVLQQNDIAFDVVSTDKIIKDELTFQPNTIDHTVYEVSSLELHDNKYDALCVVSGNMADTEAYWHDTHVKDLVTSARQSGKVVAAICCSVPTLAPITNGVKVSFFPLVRSRKRLQQFGAVLQTVSLTVDQNIATAENQMLSQMWAEEIVNLLEGKKEPLYKLVDSGYVPKGRERRMPKVIMDSIQAARQKNNQ